MLYFYTNPKTGENKTITNWNDVVLQYQKVILKNLKEEASKFTTLKGMNLVYLTSFTDTIGNLDKHIKLCKEVSKSKVFLDEVNKLSKGKAMKPCLSCVYSSDGMVDVGLLYFVK